MRLCDSNPIEVYNGSNLSAMPKLLADGRIPMSVSKLMNYRINESDKFPDWKNNWFDTSDLILYGSKSDGKVKFVLTVDKNGKITENGKEALELINPHSQRSSGAIELSQNLYNKFKGIEVAVGNLGRTGSRMPKEEILGNRAWRILSRHPDEVPAEFAEDSNLLKEYSKWVSNQTGSNENMGVYINSLSKSPKLRAGYVSGLEYGSNANGWFDLDYDSGRLVGLAPEAHGNIIKPISGRALSVEEILKESSQTNVFAQDQINKFQSILEEKGYEIGRKN